MVPNVGTLSTIIALVGIVLQQTWMILRVAAGKVSWRHTDVLFLDKSKDGFPLQPTADSDWLHRPVDGPVTMQNGRESVTFDGLLPFFDGPVSRGLYWGCLSPVAATSHARRELECSKPLVPAIA